MQPIDGVASPLARRLRSLREGHWPGRPVTQRQLASAFGVSVPSISSWEHDTVPPTERLDAYARFFATQRPVDGATPRLPGEHELTAVEQAQRDSLRRELTELRDAVRAGRGTGDSPVSGGSWHFPDGMPVTIVCAQFPDELRSGIPYVDPSDPNHSELSTFADLDALFELYGHIRAANPTSPVTLRGATALTPDDYTTHLVVLGGVDWNLATRNLLRHLDIPVTQVSDESDPDAAHFAVTNGGQAKRFAPQMLAESCRKVLVEDVAHFFRGTSPYNRKRTVTLCNGMFARGTLGVVRTLTDPRFRDRNEEYLATRFREDKDYSILTRVLINDGAVVTPDWTLARNRLHEWPGTST